MPFKQNMEFAVFDRVNYKSYGIALKKSELIEGLVRLQDEKIIQRTEAIKKGSAQGIYEQRMPKTREEIQAKLDQAEKDIIAGNVHAGGCETMLSRGWGGGFWGDSIEFICKVFRAKLILPSLFSFLFL